MKYNKKSFFAVTTALIFAFQVLSYADETAEQSIAAQNDSYAEEDAEAEEDTTAEEEYYEDLSEIEEGAYILGSVMEYIEDYYVGSDVNVDELVNAAIKGMAEILDDYSEYYSMDEYFAFEREFLTDIRLIGVVTIIGGSGFPIVTELIENSPALRAGLEVGDEITAINSTSLKNENIQEVISRYNSENSVSVEINRNGSVLTFEIELMDYKVKTVYINNINELVGSENPEINREIGYIKIDNISIGTANDFEQAVSELKKSGKNKLILDLRGNGGGIVDEAYKICNLIVPEGTIVTTRDNTGSSTVVISELKKPYFKKIVVLTDSSTASAAEMIASALQDSGAGVVVGTRTYGKGVIQTMQPVLNMGVLKMTTLEYFSRNGNKINKVGVKPNVAVDVPLFLEAKDDIMSDKVVKALSYLGYETSSRIKIMNAIGGIQKENDLSVTRTITEETAGVINLMIYSEMNNNDKILAAGYEEILKE